jgi:hypothetical protein
MSVPEKVSLGDQAVLAWPPTSGAPGAPELAFEAAA